MSDIDSKGGRSRKTETDCTAKFTVKTYEVVSDQYLAEMENSGYSSAKYKETAHLMIGCLAHSHETENKKMYRYCFSQHEKLHLIMTRRRKTVLSKIVFNLFYKIDKIV